MNPTDCDPYASELLDDGARCSRCGEHGPWDSTDARSRFGTIGARRCPTTIPTVPRSDTVADRPSRRAQTPDRVRGRHDLVFVTRDGGGFDHRNIGGPVMRLAVTSAGLGAVVDRRGNVLVDSPTFHSLRHSHASALIAAGFDIDEISARLGHASVVTTQKIYVHEFDRTRRSDDRRARLTSIYERTPETLRVVA